MTPYEIVAAPLTLWLAPIGTAFPLLTVAPAVAWVKVGTNGDLNYDEDGVTIAHSQTNESARPAGATGPIKAWRTEEDLMIRLTLWDITLEQYAAALNGNAIATVAAGAGTPGKKTIGLSQGSEIKTYALLARGLSPYGDGYAAQYEVPRCYQSASPEPAFKKGDPAGLELEFTALVDAGAANPLERFGRLVMQHQAPLP